MDDEQGKIIVAVDFGTTYSGVAFAYVEPGQDPTDVEINLIQDFWPGGDNRSSPKVPTAFKFNKKAKHGVDWGFQVDNDPDRVIYSKLYLDPRQIEAAEQLAKFSPRLGRLPPNKKPMDGISGFLAGLRDQALSQMMVEWGQDTVESTPIEYILTVPAVWSDKAKNDTLACASKAGFGSVNNIRLINEPEAAAVFTFNQLPDSAVKKGDIFITVDAGGGTVDLTTYQVLTMTPVLQVNELTEGGGGLCGSVYLNKRFEDLLMRKIGKQLSAGLSKKEFGDAMLEIQQVFNDKIKPDFGVSDEPDKTYYIPVPPSVPDDPAAGIKDSQFAVKSSELQDVFDSVVQSILGLITDQVDKVQEKAGCPDVSAILLVGGFGSSAYLRKAIEQHFDGSALPKIKVIQPVHAWSAVTRGAMLRGLQGNIVQQRVIRAAYGVNMYQTWNPDVHESAEYKDVASKLKFWNELAQTWCCDNVMKWYIQKGDEFSPDKVVTASFVRRVTSLDSGLVFTDGISIWAGNGKAPYFLDADCKTVATLRSDFSQVAADQFEIETDAQGHQHYKIFYEIEMALDARITFRLKFKGKVMSEDLHIDYAA